MNVNNLPTVVMAGDQTRDLFIISLTPYHCATMPPTEISEHIEIVVHLEFLTVKLYCNCSCLHCLLNDINNIKKCRAISMQNANRETNSRFIYYTTKLRFSRMMMSYAVKTYLPTFSKIHTHTFNGPFSETTQVSRYQKGKTNLDFTEARDSEWQ